MGRIFKDIMSPILKGFKQKRTRFKLINFSFGFIYHICPEVT